MIIYGGDSNQPADVSDAKRLTVESVSESNVASASRESGRCFSIIAIDAGPVAAEYTAYVKNISSEKDFVIDQIITSQVDADVIWKLSSVTGTAAGTAIIPVSLNLEVDRPATLELTALGGAAGVTGLTPVAELFTWMGGAVYSSYTLEVNGAIVLGQDKAIAVEYDAGTGSACSITIVGHQYPW